MKNYISYCAKICNSIVVSLSLVLTVCGLTATSFITTQAPITQANAWVASHSEISYSLPRQEQFETQQDDQQNALHQSSKNNLVCLLPGAMVLFVAAMPQLPELFDEYRSVGVKQVYNYQANAPPVLFA